jgi:hypothetical protein
MPSFPSGMSLASGAAKWNMPQYEFLFTDSANIFHIHPFCDILSLTAVFACAKINREWGT